MSKKPLGKDGWPSTESLLNAERNESAKLREQLAEEQRISTERGQHIERLYAELSASSVDLQELKQRAEAALEQEPVYAFRRLGQDSYCTCDKERYDELSKNIMFDVCVFFASPVSALELQRENARLKQVYTYECEIRNKRGEMLLEANNRIAGMQSQLAAANKRVDEMAVSIALYEADAERIWAMMSELRDTDAHYELHEAVHERLAGLGRKAAENQAMIKAMPKLIADTCFGNPPAEINISCKAAHLCVLRCEHDHYQDTGEWLFGCEGKELDAVIDKAKADLREKLVASPAEMLEWLQKKYVQEADDRQKSMGLVYMTAETHDLAESLARMLASRA